jgi:hypothetical protein
VCFSEASKLGQREGERRGGRVVLKEERGEERSMGNRNRVIIK